MVRKLTIVLLVLLVLIVALPLGMGMAMGMCPNSHASVCPSALGTCAAIVGLMALLIMGSIVTVHPTSVRAALLLLASSLDRPPRLLPY